MVLPGDASNLAGARLVAAQAGLEAVGASRPMLEEPWTSTGFLALQRLLRGAEDGDAVLARLLDEAVVDPSLATVRAGHPSRGHGGSGRCDPPKPVARNSSQTAADRDGDAAPLGGRVGARRPTDSMVRHGLGLGRCVDAERASRGFGAVFDQHGVLRPLEQPTPPSAGGRRVHGVGEERFLRLHSVEGIYLFRGEATEAGTTPCPSARMSGCPSVRGCRCGSMIRTASTSRSGASRSIRSGSRTAARGVRARRPRRQHCAVQGPVVEPVDQASPTG